MAHHFILCGLGHVGERILEHLQAAGAKVTVIDDHCPPGHARLAGAPLIVGDCRSKDVLEQAELAQARGVVIAISDDMTSLQTALVVRHLHPTVRVVVRLFNPDLLARLGPALGNMFALSTSALAAPLFAAMARTGEALGAFRLADGAGQNGVRQDGARQQVADCVVAAGSPLAGKPLTQLAADHNVTILGHQPQGQDMRYLQDVDADAALQAGDHALICGRPTDVAPLLAQGENESLPELLWAGTFQRLGRVLWRSIGLIDWPVKVCTLILVAVILVSVLVFHFGMKNDTLIDAFYRTVSLMATGADMRGEDVEPGGWQKLYISFLRLAGTGMLAAFTAIFTNYLVRANLNGALEVRRIPDCGHIVVCGLGNVSFRVLEELLSQEEQVAIIERSPDNALIATARRQKVPVIIGDATFAEVLKQANVPQARAVVAATDNELANLEIALRVGQLNPKQRVVVRVIDPVLARTLREAANVRLAISIPDLCAPAFTAALFGDHVRSLVMARGRLLAIYDILVGANETELLQRSLQEISRDFRCVPLQWLHAEQPRPLDLGARPAPGDLLTVVIALSDLQGLPFNTEPATSR